MGSPRARLGLGVRDRGGDGLLYSPPRLFSNKYARNVMRNTRVVRLLYMILLETIFMAII